MKTKFLVLTGMAAVACAGAGLYALADDSSSSEQQTRDTAQSHVIQRTQGFEMPAKASQILGREIRDGHDHGIGKVRELALDLQNGRVVEVIVATGGFLGIGEQDTAVPPDEFSWNSDSKILVCRLGQEELRNAPAFDAGHWSASVAPDRVREIYHRYNVAPYFIDEHAQKPASDIKAATELTSAGMAAPTVHLGPIERARNVLGARVENPQDERVGKVQNIIVDLTMSRIVVLIVSTGEFLGMGNEVSAIPAQAFYYDADRNVLQLSTSREALRSTPHFKPDQWPRVASSERIEEIYNAYNVPPYRDWTEANNTAQNVRDRIGGTVTPMDQGNSASDRAITAHIRREIMARPDMSIDAQNIKIITIGGHVTLRGPVKNEQEEETIIEIAKNAVKQDAAVPPDTKVTNQIQTITEPVPSKNNPPSSGTN